MDWKDIKPLTEFEARQIVKDYLIKHKFEPKDIEPRKLPQGKKSPDLLVFRNGELSFYCEIKTPEHNINPITKMYHWDTIFYKLRRFIHTARKQFNDYDCRHNYPWIVIFTSNHPQLNWTNFFHNIIGAVIYGEEIIKNFENKSFLRKSNKDLLSIDMIIWFQINYINRNEIYQAKFFINKESKFFSKTKEISNLLKLDKNN